MFYRIQLGDIPDHPRMLQGYSETMPPRYSSASELITFALRKRAWVLERRDQPTALIRVPMMGTAERAAGAPAFPQGPASARLSVFLLVLSGIGVSCAMLLAWIRR